MYAIIRAGGHQEKVSVGETITVDHLKQDPESTITFVPLLISGDDGNVISDHKQLTDTAVVTGRVVQHVRGDKIDVFHYKNKTGFRKHTGHRSMLTLVEISEIKIGDKRVTLEDAKVANEKAATEKAQTQKAAAEVREASKTARIEKAKEKKAKAKPAAKKTTAAKPGAAKTPAKKTAAKNTSAE